MIFKPLLTILTQDTLGETPYFTWHEGRWNTLFLWRITIRHFNII